MIGIRETRAEEAPTEVRPSTPLRILRRIAAGFGGLFAALVALISVFVVFGLPIELGWVKGEVERAATEALGRNFSIEGPLILEPTIPPAVQIEGVRIGNPGGWPEGDLLHLGLARTRLSVLPLLRGEIVLEQITVDQLDLTLETDASGAPNWLLTQTEDDAAEKSEPTALRFVELGELSVSGIRVLRRDAESGKSVELILEEVSGSAPDREPMHLKARGSVQDLAYEFELNAGSLEDLVAAARPWSLELEAEMAGATLTLRGEIAEPLRGKGISADFDLTGPSMKDLGVLFGTRLPPIRSFDLRGHIEEADGKYRLVGLAGEIAATGLTGSFEADLTGKLPVLSGAIEVRTIDAGPLYAAIQEEEQAPLDDVEPAREPQAGKAAPEDPAPAEKIDVDEPILTLDVLRKLDGRFSLAVHEVVNVQTSLSDAKLDVQVEEGRLRAPMSVTLAEVPFEGELALETVGDRPRVAVTLGAKESAIGELAGLLSGAEGVEGEFGAASLDFQARGESIRELVKTSELRFDMSDASLTYGHDQVGGKAVGFTIDEAQMVFPAARDSKIKAAGSLLGVPFTLEASGGTFIENFVDRSWPIDLIATGGGARADIQGTIRNVHLGQGSEIGFSLVGEPIGGIAAWIGVSPGAPQSYELSGSLNHNLSGLRIQIDQARIGDSSFAGEVGITRVDGVPETIARLDFEFLNLAGLGSLLPEEKQDRTPRQGKEVLSVDVPVLPKSIEFFDSEIEIAIARVGLKTTEISQVSFSSKIEDGYVAEAPVALAIAGSRFKGKLAADLRQEVPTVDLDVASSRVDVGLLLSELKLAKGVDLTAGSFDLALALEGVSLRQLLERSSFSASIGDGLWRINDRNTQGQVDIQVQGAKIEALPQEPIALSIDGSIARIPVKIGIKTDALASFAEPKEHLQMDLDAEFRNADLKLVGVAPLPVQAKDLHFQMDLQGKRLSDFDPLLDVSLPPVGPYRLQGKFGTRKTGYYVKDLRARVGGSNLSGNLNLNTSQRPPRLTADLTAREIQLDDFATGGWSPRGSAERNAGKLRDGKSKKGAGEEGAVPRPLLSPEVMGSMNAEIDVQVDSVQSGDDWLGSGTLTATLEDGRFSVDPLALAIPGGNVNMAFALSPGIGDLGLEARAKIEKLDYGVMARRIDPESGTGGLISLDLDLKTRGPDLERVMLRSNGYIDFALAPDDLDAGVFDLWAVNLFVALMPSLDDGGRSKVNCFVARFGIEDGIMRPNALLIDSSRIQASGDGVINFKTETIDFLAKPKSKRPQMFSVKTPIQVQGTFSDFKVGLPPGALVGTVFRLVSSPVSVPFQWVFTEKEPADGRIACKRAWSKEAAPRETAPSRTRRRAKAEQEKTDRRGTGRKASEGAKREEVLQPGDSL